MNETLKTIAKRYSCRDFTNKSIARADLQAIADAAVQSPSARNVQGWFISIVSDKALLDKIESEGLRVMSEAADKSAYERIAGRGGRLFYNARAVAFVAVNEARAESYKRYSLIDLGIVAQSISLAATSLGIDNCHCGMVSFCFAGERAKEFNKGLGLPAGYECNYGVLLGYGATECEPRAADKSKAVIIE